MQMEEIILKLQQYTMGMEYPQIQIGIINGDEEVVFSWDGKELSSTADNTIYEIGSITKTFTAGILAKAISEGKVTLTDTVERFVEDLPEGYIYPSLMQLATHTCGYSNELKCTTEEKAAECEARMSAEWTGDEVKDNLYGHLLEEDLLETIRAYKLEKDQYDFCYSNVGYCVLGYILSKVYGLPYDRLLTQYIHEELKLKDSYAGRPDRYEERICVGYNSANEKCGNWLWKDSAFMGAGCIYSTLKDVMQYVRTNMERKVPYLELTYQKAYANTSYGFDVGLAWIKSGDIVWHNGGTGCFRSFAGFDSKHRKGVVILSNYKENNGITVDDIGFYILKE